MIKYYEGVYKDYDEALSHLDKKNTFSSKLYEDNQKKIINKVIRCINKEIAIPSFYKQHTQYLTYLISTLYKDKKLNVLDFGGGWGVGFANILESNNKNITSNLDYTVYELENICNLGEKFFKKKLRLKKNIQFTSDIDKLGKKYYDIIFLGSSLQYVYNFKETLKKINNLNARYILMIDVYAGEIPTFCTLQKYYNFKMPHWFLNISEINSIFNTKYKMVNKSYAHTMRLDKLGNPDMSNFKKKYRLNNSINLLFVRK